MTLCFLHLHGMCSPGDPHAPGRALPPRLSRLASAGATIELHSPPPDQTAARAVTLATGFLADAHGILSDDEPRPDLLGARPASSDGRHRPAIWEIAAAAGKSAVSVGWPATHPASPQPSMPGLRVVTSAFASHNSRHRECWPMTSGCIQPESLRPELAQLRVCALQITAQQLGGLIPALAEIDQDRDDVLQRLATALARCATNHAAATLMAEQQPDLLCVHLALAAEVHRVCRELRPRSIRADGSSPLDDATSNAAAFLDLVTGRYMNLCGHHSQYVIVLDPPPGCDAPGLCILHGPGIRPTRAQASTVDIVPTILSLLGLPLAADMDGRPIAPALDVAPRDVELWTHEIQRAAPTAIDPSVIRGIMDDLRSQGYQPPPRRAAADIDRVKSTRLEAIRQIHAYSRTRRDHPAAGGTASM